MHCWKRHASGANTTGIRNNYSNINPLKTQIPLNLLCHFRAWPDYRVTADFIILVLWRIWIQLPIYILIVLHWFKDSHERFKIWTQIFNKPFFRHLFKKNNWTVLQISEDKDGNYDDVDTLQHQAVWQNTQNIQTKPNLGYQGVGERSQSNKGDNYSNYVQYFHLTLPN